MTPRNHNHCTGCGRFIRPSQSKVRLIEHGAGTIPTLELYHIACWPVGMKALVHADGTEEC